MAITITATGPQTHHARDALVRDLWRHGAGEFRIARELGISRRSARRRMERLDLEIGGKAGPVGQEAPPVD